MGKLALNGGAPVAKGVSENTKWPLWDRNDREAVIKVLESGDWCRLHPGSAAEEFEKKFAVFQDAKHAIATANGTVSIELCLRTLGVNAGDEIIVPALTFIATASAVANVGAIPILADSDPDTFCISADSISQSITERTRGIIAVHYGGYPVDFDAILPVAKKHNLFVIEDCAHAHGTEWKGTRVGAIGTCGSFSFQQAKSLSSGEGGAVLSNDSNFHERAMLIHNIGREVGLPGYAHRILSSNYRLSEFQSALLISQLCSLDKQVKTRQANGDFLAEELSQLGGLEPLKRDPRVTGRGYYYFCTKYDSHAFDGLPRERFVEALNAEGIPCGTAYGVPLHKQPAFRKDNLRLVYGNRTDNLPDYDQLRLPIVEELCKRQITFYHTLLLLDRDKLALVIEAVKKIKDNLHEIKSNIDMENRNER